MVIIFDLIVLIVVYNKFKSIRTIAIPFLELINNKRKNIDALITVR